MAFVLALTAASFWIASCASPLGPGYSIESQEIRVQFEPSPEPKIHVEASYHLRNIGARALRSLELRLPGRRSFRTEGAQAIWEDSAIAPEVSPANPRETLLDLPKPWKTSERRTLRLSVTLLSSSDNAGVSFAQDAFFLPSESWAPELLPTRGLFGRGGVPPNQWRLSVRVPEGFLVHTSGRSPKRSQSGGEITVQTIQSTSDQYPFVVAGRYKESQFNAGREKVTLWARSNAAPANLHQSVDSIARTVEAYDATFGNRPANEQSLWVVECPIIAGCFTAQKSSYAPLLGAEPESTSAELISANTLMVDFTNGGSNLAAAAPSLAASWLGYGRNPGFYEQDFPLAAFPAFASALGREAVLGPSTRGETIRRGLQLIPSGPASRTVETDNVLRAKSFLFFYALQDRYGRDVFRRAVDHMLAARQGRGFDLSDLIAAFEQETHENVAEFVRLWMKRPGVPADFRTRYESSSVALDSKSKEIIP